MFVSNSNLDTADEFARRLDSAGRVAAADGVPLVCLGSLYTYVDISSLNEEI